MNVEHNKQPAGSLKISQEVLATIANFASEEIDGVVSLANTYTPIKNFLKKGSIARPIQISLNDDVAVIDISVNLKCGAEHDRHHRIQGQRTRCRNRFPTDLAGCCAIRRRAVTLFAI